MPQTPPDRPAGEEASDEVSGELVVVARFQEARLANTALGQLQSGGLKAFLADETTVSAHPLISDSADGIRLMVHASQAGRAVEILDDHGGKPRD